MAVLELRRKINRVFSNVAINNIRRSHPKMFHRTAVLKDFPKFLGKHMSWGPFYNTVASQIACNFMKKRFCQGCFSEHLVKFSDWLYFQIPLSVYSHIRIA